MSAVSVTVTGFNGERNVAAATVIDALEQAGYSGEVSVRLNGEQVQDPANTPVQENDELVAAAPSLKGGC